VSNPINDWLGQHTAGMRHAVDFGAGRFDYTRKIKSGKVTGVDVWPSYVKSYCPASIEGFVGDMCDWQKMGLGEFDCAVLIDSLEHVSFERGVQMIADLIDSGHVKKILVFTPEGEHPQTLSHVKGSWAEGNEHQEHKSTWVASDLMELGFQVDSRPNFHHENPPGTQAAMFGVWVSDE